MGKCTILDRVHAFPILLVTTSYKYNKIFAAWYSLVNKFTNVELFFQHTILRFFNFIFNLKDYV